MIVSFDQLEKPGTPLRICLIEPLQGVAQEVPTRQLFKQGEPLQDRHLVISAFLKSSSDPRHDCSTWPLSVKPVLKMARETSWVRARILLTLSLVTFNYCAMSLNIELTTINIMEMESVGTNRQTDKKTNRQKDKQTDWQKDISM